MYIYIINKVKTNPVQTSNVVFINRIRPNLLLRPNGCRSGLKPKLLPEPVPWGSAVVQRPCKQSFRRTGSYIIRSNNDFLLCKRCVTDERIVRSQALILRTSCECHRGAISSDSKSGALRPRGVQGRGPGKGVCGKKSPYRSWKIFVKASIL